MSVDPQNALPTNHLSESSARASELLARPIQQRSLEFKYRCAQATIFGLPVLALQYFGRGLGGAEAVRWVAILQAILAGWVVYVAAAGIFFEGVLTLGRGVSADLMIAALAIAAYLWSAGSVLMIFVTGRVGYQPLLFHACVFILAAWTGLRWWRLGSS